MNSLKLKTRIEDQLGEHIEILEGIIRDPLLPATQRITAIRQLQSTLKLLDRKAAQEDASEPGSEDGSSVEEEKDEKISVSVG